MHGPTNVRCAIDVLHQVTEVFGFAAVEKYGFYKLIYMLHYFVWRLQYTPHQHTDNNINKRTVHTATNTY